LLKKRTLHSSKLNTQMEDFDDEFQPPLPKGVEKNINIKNFTSNGVVSKLKTINAQMIVN
jgi:hypothetical protein